VIELAIAAVLSVIAALAWGFVVSAFPQADPARSAVGRVADEAASHGAVRRFLRARLDPGPATGLVLTVALVAVVVVFVVFGVLADMIRSRSGVVTVDLAVTRWAATHATATSLSVFGWVTRLGSTIVVVPAALVVTAYALRTWRRWDVALFFLFVLGGQLLLVNLIKLAVGRVRPDVPPFHMLSGASFPSGHATAAAATWAAVALVVGRAASRRTRIVLAGAAVAIAVAVACSRVFLGAHWMSDVIGGLLLGWTWFALCAVAFGGRVLRLGVPAQEAASSSASELTGAPDGEHAEERAPAEAA
jgi:membrane-associated phospholipid phosphatase